MARIHDNSDEELPPLQEVINKHRRTVSTDAQFARNDRPVTGPDLFRSPEKRHSPRKNAIISNVTASDSAAFVPKGCVLSSASGLEKEARVQRPLRVAHVNSLLLPVNPAQSTRVRSPKKTTGKVEGANEQLRIGRSRLTPRRTVKSGVGHDLEVFAEQENVLEGFERLKLGKEEGGESTWCGAWNEEEGNSDPPKDGVDIRKLNLPKLTFQHRPKLQQWRSSKSSTPSLEPEGVIDMTSPVRLPKRPGSKLPSLQQAPILLVSRAIDGLGSSSEIDSGHAILRFSPPHSRSPRKCPSTDSQCRPVTPPLEPPASPSKSRLTSPSKKKLHIPPVPHRPSIDAFWSQDVVNEWNDQYSPRKVLRSPKKLHFLLDGDDEDDDADLSPSERRSHSPRKGGSSSRGDANPPMSPRKTDKAVVQSKKEFEGRKRTIAEQFLKQIDDVITGGKIAEMCAEMGGVSIVWSRKLNSTAGRANWKREGVRIRGGHGNDNDNGNGNGEVKEGKADVRWRHVASIELAEKVIDDEDRLRNVLAHEYCHLANFMISGVKNNPHGKEFKEWAARVTAAFHDCNVSVTTKHSYAISYKYIWMCVNPACGVEYKRHSKSIDSARHTCGSCKGKLMQIKPVPKKGEGDEREEKSEYQRFVKETFKDLKARHPEWGLGRVMKELGREYRVRKEKGMGGEADIVAGNRKEVDGLLQRLDLVKLDD